MVPCGFVKYFFVVECLECHFCGEEILPGPNLSTELNSTIYHITNFYERTDRGKLLMQNCFSTFPTDCMIYFMIYERWL